VAKNDLRVFANRMRVIGRTVERRTALLVANTVNNLAEDIIPATPVLTGKARINWVAQERTPPTEIIERENAPETAASEAIAKVASVVSKLQSGDVTVYLSNNAEYIGLLNDGSSKQAPELFVQLAVVRAIQKMHGFKVTTER